MAVGTTAAAGPGGAPAPVEPGPWAPPGEQPIPFYIGNAAHTGIAASYVAAHRGDVVRTNASPIGSMLTTLKRMLGAQGEKIDKGALSEDDIGLMPDITNLTRLHLYEIKPLAAESAGAAKAAPLRKFVLNRPRSRTTAGCHRRGDRSSSETRGSRCARRPPWPSTLSTTTRHGRCDLRPSATR